MNHIYSSPEIEEACRRDINFMWLLGSARMPGHSTTTRFASLYFAPCAERIMDKVAEFLKNRRDIRRNGFHRRNKNRSMCKQIHICLKKSCHENMEKPAAFVGECGKCYGLKITYHGQVKMKHVRKLRRRLYALKKEQGIEFVHGTGKTKHPLQRSIETPEGHLAKLKEYTQKIHTCEDRNS